MAGNVTKMEENFVRTVQDYATVFQDLLPSARAVRAALKACCPNDAADLETAKEMQAQIRDKFFTHFTTAVDELFNDGQLMTRLADVERMAAEQPTIQIGYRYLGAPGLERDATLLPTMMAYGDRLDELMRATDAEMAALTTSLSELESQRAVAERQLELHYDRAVARLQRVDADEEDEDDDEQEEDVDKYGTSV